MNRDDRKVGLAICGVAPSGLLGPALFALLVLAGCSFSLGPKQPSQQELALACELTKCFCLGEPQSFFGKATTAAVLFRSDGSAYCPPGLLLQKGENNDVQNRRY
jgi:hypothetical protein